MQISGNTIFIPGGTGGIGLALAVRLAARGNTVTIGGRRPADLERITTEHPELDAVVIDVADPSSIAHAAAEVIRRHPELNVLVTMAGIMRVEDWHSADGFVRSAEAVVTTNLLGSIRLIGAFIAQLGSRPDATIMTVSSGLAFAPLAATPSYNASKAGIHLLSESIRLQLADTGVRVIELEPPAVRTGLLPGQSQSAVAMPLEDFAEEVMAILERDPDVREVQVENVKFLRYGEARGDYEQVVARLNRLDPHGR